MRAEPPTPLEEIRGLIAATAGSGYHPLFDPIAQVVDPTGTSPQGVTSSTGSPMAGGAPVGSANWLAGLWGGKDNETSHVLPGWMQDLVKAYLAAPSKKQWQHLVNQVGVADQYKTEMPQWVRDAIIAQIGAEPA